MRLIGPFLILPLAILVAQQRFGNDFPKLKGFTKSPTEHIMKEYEGTPEIRKVRGKVVEASSGTGIPDAIFELRSENPDDLVRGVNTTPDGGFCLNSVRDGRVRVQGDEKRFPVGFWQDQNQPQSAGEQSED